MVDCQQLLPHGPLPLKMDPQSEKENAGVFGSGGRLDPEKLLEEKHRMLANTRAFLQLICEGEGANRRYIKEFEGQLANDVRRLETELDRDTAEGSVSDKSDTD